MFCCFLFLALSEPPEGDENALTYPTFSEWFFKPNKHQPPVQQERVMKFAKRSLRSAAKSEDFAINFLTGLLLKSGVTNEDIDSNRLSEELTKFVGFLSSSNSFIDSASYNQMLADNARKSAEAAPEEQKEAPQKPKEEKEAPKRREKRKAKKSEEEQAQKQEAKKSEDEQAQKQEAKGRKKNSIDPQAVQWTFQQPMNVQYPMNMQFVPVQYVVPQYAQQVNSDAKMRRRRHHRRAHKHT